MPTILVTGANGFIGRELCRRSAEKGWQVRGGVRNPEMADLPAGVAPIKMDLLAEGTHWDPAFEGVDCVIHLAAFHHVQKPDQEDLSLFRRLNVQATADLYRLAQQSGTQRFVFLSTAKVHGTGRGAPWREADPVDPRDPYGKSKAEAESLLRGLSGKGKTQVTVLRPPLVYGPGVGANFLRLMEAVYRGMPLPLGSVRNRRSFVYIGNLVDAVLHSVIHPDAAGETFFVSDGEDLSTPELMRRVAFQMEKPSRIFPFPTAMLKLLFRLGGKGPEVERLTETFVVDSRKIRQTLSWSPPFSCREGLRETVNWFLRQKHSSS